MTAAEAAVDALRARLSAAQQLVAQERLLACEVFSVPLPPLAVEHIFRLLPADTRLRCREVSRAWRAFLEDRRLWAELNLNPFTSCIPRASAALLNAAAVRAGGRMRTLRVESCTDISFESVLAVLQANSESLREVNVTCLGGGHGTDSGFQARLKHGHLLLRSSCVRRRRS